MIAAYSLMGAQGPVSAVQDALKREHLYFGERTGVLDEATRSALLRFQVQRGLPGTGEIDAATLQALQSSAESTQPTVQSLPPATVGPVASEETVRKDREFLQRLEQSDATSSTAVGAAAPAPAPATPPEPVAEAPQTNKVESVPPARSAERSRHSERRKTADASPREKPQASRPVERIVREEAPSDSAERGGRKTARSSKTSAGGRSYASEERSYSDAPVVTVRRALPVEPPRKRGFFDRIFNDDDDD